MLASRQEEQDVLREILLPALVRVKIILMFGRIMISSVIRDFDGQDIGGPHIGSYWGRHKNSGWSWGGGGARETAFLSVLVRFELWITTQNRVIS